MAHRPRVVIDLPRRADADAEQLVLCRTCVGHGLAHRGDDRLENSGGPAVLGRGQAALPEDGALLVDDDGLDLRAAEVDPSTQHQRAPFPSVVGQWPPFSQ